MTRLILPVLLLITIGCKQNPPVLDVLDHVDPMIGTGFHGHTYPGVTLPFGAVQLSPDTRINGWDACSGYHASDTTILGFSHTHLSGTGIGDLGDVLILPYSNDPAMAPVATFRHENETARAGYYRVRFDNYPVTAELTTTEHVGYHRYTWDKGVTPHILLDLSHSLHEMWGRKSVADRIELVDAQTIRGMRQSTGWAQDEKCYFYLHSSVPFKVITAYRDSLEIPVEANMAGAQLWAHLEFADGVDQVELQVGISGVDEAGAEKNWQAEGQSPFDAVRTQAENAWREALAVVEVKAAEPVMKNFYTALYHTMLAPQEYQDVDGRYRGMDKQIHQADGFTNYTVYSLWDVFRAWYPLMTIVQPQRAGAWAQNLVLKYQEGGLLPKWPLVANYTGTMVGYPAAAVLADAMTKDLSGIDWNQALEALQIASTYHPERLANIPESGARGVMSKHIHFIEKNQFVPVDSVGESVSYGLECAYYDWCIAQVAHKLGRDSLAAVYDQRAKYYQLYFDPQTGFMRGKLSNGQWRVPFSPRYSQHDQGDFTEGNAWQWSWFVPHDVQAYAQLMGGDQVFINKLDSLFSVSSEIEGANASADITGLIGQYAHGNEPSHHIAYLYDYLGQPWKTQEIVDTILTTLYAPTLDGIVGNEDCGQMSAWYVLSTLGFYQVCPGDPVYAIGRPLVDEATIHLHEGKTFHIVAKNNNLQNKYIQSATLNGKPLEEMFFSHLELMNGGELVFEMSHEPKME